MTDKEYFINKSILFIFLYELIQFNVLSFSLSSKSFFKVNFSFLRDNIFSINSSFIFLSYLRPLYHIFTLLTQRTRKSCVKKNRKVMRVIAKQSQIFNCPRKAMARKKHMKIS